LETRKRTWQTEPSAVAISSSSYPKKESALGSLARFTLKHRSPAAPTVREVNRNRGKKRSERDGKKRRGHTCTLVLETGWMG
jgi:hypothetical protein